MNLEHAVKRREGVTFVRATVHNPAPVTRHVRLENRLDGAVLPPRRNGVPERGWDEDGVTLTVPPEATLGVGYACRSPPAEPPVGIEATGRGPAPDDSGVRRARRALGTFRPPRAVVAGGEIGRDEAESGRDEARNRIGGPGGPADRDHRGDDAERAAMRVELGCRLADADVEEAIEVIETLGESDLVAQGGIEGVRTLVDGLEGDASTLDREASRLRSAAQRLREAAERADASAERAGERARRARNAEVPLDALGSFA
ncbi:MAG: hypothetical protein V5A46_00605 [Haloferacaceae archaeon]